ncbi:MAG: EamA family transporter [Candidatus Eisenbacteria bacterium]|nr:EamA family transporter [Candidatus Eisenbacteria bacterium]
MSTLATAPRAAPPAPGAGPWTAFGTCCLIWGSTFLFISIGNDAVPPVWAAALRLALAALLLSGIALAMRHPFPRGAALRAAAWYGFWQFGVSFPLLYWGEQRVASGLTAVLYATIPLTTALLARAFRLERLRVATLAGAAAALAGVALIFSGQLGADVPAASLFALVLAATTASLSGVLLKRGPRQSPLWANAAGAWAGLPLCLGASLALGEPHRLPATLAGWGPILYLTLAGSIGAFVLFAWLVGHWPVTRVSFIGVVTPVVALALGALVRHERLAAASLAGSALVLAGVVLGLRGHAAGAPPRAPGAETTR